MFLKEKYKTLETTHSIMHTTFNYNLMIKHNYFTLFQQYHQKLNIINFTNAEFMAELLH